MKLIWTSDVHLNFLYEQTYKRNEFYQQLKDAEGDAILITGDIAESHNIEKYLEEMNRIVRKQIYFVAGNHDYYGSSIRTMRARLKKIGYAHYLPKSSYVKLNKHTALVGQDGWGDCRNGDYEGSQRGFRDRFIMSDWIHIKELNKAYHKSSDDLLITLQRIADKDAERITKSVLHCLRDKNVTRIIIATHVPPFEEACLYAGRKSTPFGLPFFSSQILGVAILPIVEANPNIDFLWFSGHTHSSVTVEKRPNLIVLVAQSEYYRPQIADIIEC